MTKQTKQTRTGLAWIVSAASLVAGAGACGGEPPRVDLGSNVAKLSDYAASWDGYAEAEKFPTGNSDRVRLLLDATGAGTLEVGEGAPLPVPTQAEGGYLTDGVMHAQEDIALFRDGFKYPVHAARVDAGRIRLGIDPLEIFGAWCAFAPPVTNSGVPSGYSCAAEGGGFSFDPMVCDYQYTDANGVHQMITVDCGIYLTCIGRNPCTCSATSCGPHVIEGDVGDPDAYPIVIDGAIDATGSSVTGTLAIKDGGTTERITIRLHK